MSILKSGLVRDMAATNTPGGYEQPLTPITKLGPIYWGNGEFGRIVGISLGVGFERHVVLSARLYHP